MAAKEMKERKGEATTIKLHTDMTVLVETLDKEKADPCTCGFRAWRQFRH